MSRPPRIGAEHLLLGSIFLIGVIIMVLFTIEANAQEVIVISDDEYYEHCQAPQFGGRPQDCEFLRPFSAPRDCGMPDFSPTHPFCTRAQIARDISDRCDGFGPPALGCER